MDSDEKPHTVRVIQISEDTLRTIIQESVGEALALMGVTWKDPTEMQKDFSHLREWRETTESIKRKGITALILGILSGLAAMAWLGIKDSVRIIPGGH